MSRYIDAEWLKQNFNTVFWSQVTKTIDSAPSINIVFCHECKHWHKKGELTYCDRIDYGYGYKADDFCSYGMRNADSNTLNTLDALDDNSSEKPNNCEVKNYCDDCLYTDTCDDKAFFYACTSKATISKMEQVDEPQTEREGE